MTYWLPRVTAHPDVPGRVLMWVHEALTVLPEHVADRLWPCGVSVRATFPWDSLCQHGISWKEVGGYWNSDTRYAVINAQWCTSREAAAAVVLHELGHGMSIDMLDKPHRGPAFRAAWSAARQEVKRRHPSDYTDFRALGCYCQQWTRAVQEVWAEAFAWIYGARCMTHPAFGKVFADCITLVRADLDALAGEVE